MKLPKCYTRPGLEGNVALPAGDDGGRAVSGCLPGSHLREEG